MIEKFPEIVSHLAGIAERFATTLEVHAITGQTDADYSIRQAAYDLRNLRGKQLVDKPARTRRYRVPALAARTVTALLTLRDQIIAPILAGVRSPTMGRKPKVWNRIGRDYEQSAPTCRPSSTTWPSPSQRR